MKIFVSIALLVYSLNSLASVDVRVRSGRTYDVNKKLRIGMELTAVSDKGYEAGDYDRESMYQAKKVASYLYDQYPEASEFEQYSANGYRFNDGHSSKPRWKIEVDGRVVRDFEGTKKLHPIIEVTTTYAKTERIDVMDTVMDSWKKLGATPNKLIGGGHVRVRVKKKDVTAQQVANVLKLYYSWQDHINFAFRSKKREHDMAAPTLAAKKPMAYELFETTFLNKNFGQQTGDQSSVMNTLGGYLKRRNVGIILGNDYEGYDKFFAFNLGRLYASWARGEDKNSLDFEFRLFDAPRTKDEARLHYKFVMALFNKALNGNVTYERKRTLYGRYYFTSNWKEFLKYLDLDPSEYNYILESIH